MFLSNGLSPSPETVHGLRHGASARSPTGTRGAVTTPAGADGSAALICDAMVFRPLDLAWLRTRKSLDGARGAHRPTTPPEAAGRALGRA